MNGFLNEFRTTFQEILNSTNIVITSHKSPDGDSLGSSLSLYHFIKKFNPNVAICHPDEAPHYFDWITDISKIKLFETNKDEVIKIIQEADLIFCLDFNDFKRLGDDFGDLVQKSDAKKVMIDHHQNPSINSFISISDTTIASTSELIFELIFQTDNLLAMDAPIAEMLYMGIMTDTGSFRFPSVSSRTHEIISILLKVKINHSKIHEKIYDSNSLDKIRLKSYAIVEKLEVLPKYLTGIISLTKKELERFNYKKGDTEGLVNSILSIENILVAAIFIEHKDGIKISFRSKGRFFVNELANKHFNGGGHKYAAGGFSSEKLEQAVNRFKKLIAKNEK